jgi:nucleoside-diphosphate-sugar epimerase
MAVWGHALARREGVLAADVLARPIGTYALTKSLAEEVARYFSDRLEVITLRIAAPVDLFDPHLRSKRIRPQQVPFPDLAQAFASALTVPLSRYEVVTIVGESSRRLWDLEAARRVLNYVPQYRLDDYVTEFANPFDVVPE